MATKPHSIDPEENGLESVLGDDDEFQEAALFVQNNISLFSRDDLLYLYARFKQFTVGDVNVPKPGLLNFEAKAKWNAWNNLKSTSKSQAAQEYITKVNDIKQKNHVTSQKSTGTGPSVSRLLIADETNTSGNHKKTIYEYCQDGDEANVERLLKLNFDVNRPDEMQLYLVHWAADRGHDSILRLLAKYGADLNVRDEDGQTPLFYATLSGNIASIKTLLELGADPTIANNDGALPSSIAETDEERAIFNRQ